jgi:CRISPR/Cas system-associated protein Cas10 (large subunit of type III CRISPR-Cas system)
MPRVKEARQCHVCGMHRAISRSIPQKRRDKLLALAGDEFTCDMVCETCGVKRTLRERLAIANLEAMQAETSEDD